MKHHALFLALALLIPFAHAEDASMEHTDVGMAFSVTQSPYVGGKAQLSARPTLLEYKGFDIAGPAWSFSKAPSRELYVGVGFDPWDRKHGDSTELSDMHKLDQAVNLRVGGAWKIGTGVANVDLAQEVTGVHRGAQTKLRYTHNPAPYQHKVRPFVEAQWLSAKLTDYYVGVHGDDVTAQRPAYQAGSTVALKAGVKFEHVLSKRFTLLGGIDLTHYGKAIGDSPIIARDNVAGASLGLAYRWR